MKGTTVPFIIEIKYYMLDKLIVNQIVDEFLQGTEYYLVDLKLSSDNRIQVEIDSFGGVSLDVCAELNRYIESKLDREEEDYELEVGSAGLTTPFKVLKQYEKNVGNEIEVLTVEGKKITGKLEKVTAEGIGLTIEKLFKEEGAKRKKIIQEEISLSFENIKTTKQIIRFK